MGLSTKIQEKEKLKRKKKKMLLLTDNITEFEKIQKK